MLAVSDFLSFFFREDGKQLFSIPFQATFSFLPVLPAPPKCKHCRWLQNPAGPCLIIHGLGEPGPMHASCNDIIKLRRPQEEFFTRTGEILEICCFQSVLRHIQTTEIQSNSFKKTVAVRAAQKVSSQPILASLLFSSTWQGVECTLAWNMFKLLGDFYHALLEFLVTDATFWVSAIYRSALTLSIPRSNESSLLESQHHLQVTFCTKIYTSNPMAVTSPFRIC